ncbi:MAG: type II secretion system protein GspC [Thiohalomonadaceae bacterium]
MAARWATWLLVVSCSISLAQLSWQLIPAPLSQPRLTAPQTTISANSTNTRLESLARLHLFGKSIDAAPAASNQANAPETSLNLTLRGLFAVKNRAEALAIISLGDNNERHFRIGDQVSSGVVVHDILADRVVLEHAGRYETLRLPKNHLNTTAAATSHTDLPTAMQLQLQELRQSILSNPDVIMQLADFQPAIQDGLLRGYYIRPRRHNELFKTVGLLPNDIVTHVNDIPVTEPARFVELGNMFAQASSLQLSIDRPDGMTENIVINLNQGN